MDLFSQVFYAASNSSNGMEPDERLLLVSKQLLPSDQQSKCCWNEVGLEHTGNFHGKVNRHTDLQWSFLFLSIEAQHEAVPYLCWCSHLVVPTNWCRLSTELLSLPSSGKVLLSLDSVVSALVYLFLFGIIPPYSWGFCFVLCTNLV